MNEDRQNMQICDVEVGTHTLLLMLFFVDVLCSNPHLKSSLDVCPEGYVLEAHIDITV